MWWAPHQGIGWWMIFGGLWMLVFWGVIIGLVIWGIRAMTERRVEPMAGSGPLEIAEGRFARGEISKEEFNDIKTTLGRR